MDSGPAGAGNQLLHVDVQIDELEPRRGILDLLRRLRPRWKAQDIQMKASVCAPGVSICSHSTWLCIYKNMSEYTAFLAHIGCLVGWLSETEAWSFRSTITKTFQLVGVMFMLWVFFHHTTPDWLLTPRMSMLDQPLSSTLTCVHQQFLLKEAILCFFFHVKYL